jgi:hypothetical protein
MNLATNPRLYPAKQMNTSQKKALALAAIRKGKSITELAQNNNVSRKFIYQQQAKAISAVNDKFSEPKQQNEKVLFYLPVTFQWLCQLVLCLMLHCRSSHRGIQKLLLDVFDYNLSLGTIHNIADDVKTKAKEINQQQDLTNITLAAQDEVFHYNKPILTGIDIPSLYCYLLANAQNRDFDTWGMHLLDLKNQNLNPNRFINDDASAIKAAAEYVYPNTPCDLDHFHIIKDLMDLRRYFRNCLKTAITNTKTLQAKVDKAVLTEKLETYHSQLEIAKTTEKEMHDLSTSIDTLVSWMQHDVLNMPGLEPNSRGELFDFILDEFNQLAKQHSHRIKKICTTLKNQKPYLLAFADVLNEKFQAIADEFIYPIEKIWEMCKLQRCKHSSDNYAVRSLPLQDYFGYDFDEIEDAVLEALDSTERTSSMIENLHSRIKPYFLLRREIGFGYLDLLQFYLNHTPFLRSAREERKNKTPTEILTGQPHPHWLEMLGYQRFKRAA